MNITSSSFRIDPRLYLPEDEVQLWRIDLAGIRGDESRWQKVLSSDESARAARFHFDADRQRYITTRAWLRMLLASYLQTDAKQLSFSYSKKEKPLLAPAYDHSGITFNISHSGEIALLAFARQREIGVDVEQVRENRDLEAIARRFFSANEQTQLFALPAAERPAAFYRCWTRKEAYIKAVGDGLSLPLSQFDVALAHGNNDALLATRPDASEAAKWRLREVSPGPGYAAAVCAHGRDWRLRE